MTSLPERWAVVTGSLREPIELRMVMSRLIAWRDDGRLDGVVLSTWERDVPDAQDFLDLLARAGVVVVASEQPAFSPGSSFYQFKAFAAGLQQTPPGAWVLKARTDKVIHRLVAYGHVLDRLRNDPEFSAQHQEKTFVESALSTEPFFIPDFAFLGRHEHLRRSLAFDSRFDVIGSQVGVHVEQRWFCEPFLDGRPRLAAHMTTFNQRAFSRAVIGLAGRSKGETALPGIVNRMLADYFDSLCEGFSMLRVAGPIPEDLGFHNLFSPPEKLNGWPLGYGVDHSYLLNSRLAQAAVSGELPDSPMYRRFLEDYADKDRRMQAPDKEELAEFREAVVTLDGPMGGKPAWKAAFRRDFHVLPPASAALASLDDIKAEIAQTVGPSGSAALVLMDAEPYLSFGEIALKFAIECERTGDQGGGKAWLNAAVAGGLPEARFLWATRGLQAGEVSPKEAEEHLRWCGERGHVGALRRLAEGHRDGLWPNATAERAAFWDAEADRRS